MARQTVLRTVGAALHDILDTNRTALYLFLTAFVLRMLFFAFMLGQVLPSEMAALSPDVRQYMAVAYGLAGMESMNESALFVFGWGYPVFLWFCSYFVGFGPIWLILIQIVLSSLSSVLVYRVASELVDNEKTAIVAGYIAVISATSISLANFLLSDTLFFFLFALGNLWFIKGLKTLSRKYFIMSGMVFAYAVCTRSMVQFWPIAMILLLLVWPLLQSTAEKKERFRYLKIGFWAPLIVIIVMAAWMIRNNAVHDLPIMAFAGPHGIGKVIANAQGKTDGREMRDVQLQWYEEYRAETGKTDLSYKEIYEITMAQGWRLFREHPGLLIGTYVRLAYENIVADNELYFSQCPKYKDRIQSLLSVPRKKGYTKILFACALLGLVMLWSKYRMGAVYLSAIYLYVIVMVGFGQWQGSRLFYPAMPAEAIFIAYFLVAGIELVNRKLLLRFLSIDR
ncbi:MAG: glycosyltransferase family 39 protein [Candidatus Zixiibacteriota bacterium]